jgi:hypothetical protein
MGKFPPLYLQNHSPILGLIVLVDLSEVPMAAKDTIPATARMMAGVAEAFRKGFEIFAEQIDKKSEKGEPRRMTDDFIDGVTSTMEELPKVARRYYDDMMPPKETKESTEKATREIDYERLAKLVATELAARSKAE